MHSWITEKKTNITTAIRIPLSRTTTWEQWGLLFGDAHIDNPHSQLKLHKKHLEQAKERGAFIIGIGDTFDAMQGKSDKRADKSDLRPEVSNRSYLNSLVDFAYTFYSPYAPELTLLSKGNHETSVIAKVEYDLLDGLTCLLQRDGSPVICGGYRGWIQFFFNDGEFRTSKTAYYHHGSGGGGPVTKGIIGTNRKAIEVPDADFVFTGHIHEQWKFPIWRARLKKSGIEEISAQYHIQVPTYKEEYANEDSGFHHITGKPPKPLGAWWIRFYWSPDKNDVQTTFIEADV